MSSSANSTKAKALFPQVVCWDHPQRQVMHPFLSFQRERVARTRVGRARMARERVAKSLGVRRKRNHINSSGPESGGSVKLPRAFSTREIVMSPLRASLYSASTQSPIMLTAAGDDSNWELEKYNKWLSNLF